MPEDVTIEVPATPETPAAPETPAYDWRTDIHPDVKDDKLWASVPDVRSLTKGYADAVKYNVGAIKMPAADASPEEVGKFYDKLGRPASPEGYAVGEGHPAGSEFLALRAVAHDAGLSAKQFQQLQDGYARLHGEHEAAARQTAKQVTEELRTEWGGAYDKKMGLAQRAIKMGGEELWTKVGGSPLGNDPAFIKWVAQIGEALAEEGMIDGQIEGVPTKDTAKQELDTLTASKAYLQASDPGHAAAVERARKLFQLVYS